MRHSLLLVVLALTVAGAGCREVRPRQEPVATLKPGAVGQSLGSRETALEQEPAADGKSPPPDDAEPPLLLDEGPDISFLPKPAADNSRCHVCHMNYVQEDMAVVHARARIGCADCHGESDAHIADESWSWGGRGTAPDVMYPPEKINPFCMGCHPKEKIATESHEPLLAGTMEAKYCTDCHGKHRLAQRRCKWK